MNGTWYSTLARGSYSGCTCSYTYMFMYYYSTSRTRGRSYVSTFACDDGPAGLSRQCCSESCALITSPVTVKSKNWLCLPQSTRATVQIPGSVFLLFLGEHGPRDLNRGPPKRGRTLSVTVLRNGSNNVSMFLFYSRAMPRPVCGGFRWLIAETATNGAIGPPGGASGAGRWRQSALGGGASGAGRWRQSALGGGASRSVEIPRVAVRVLRGRGVRDLLL
eukprot:COSAG02_NODE_12470_length_1539_cov_74.268563_1_plen_220_part_00